MRLQISMAYLATLATNLDPSRVDTRGGTHCLPCPRPLTRQRRQSLQGEDSRLAIAALRNVYRLFRATRISTEGMGSIPAGRRGKYAHYKAEQQHRWNDATALGGSPSAQERRQKLEQDAWKEARRRTRKRENMAREINKARTITGNLLGS